MKKEIPSTIKPEVAERIRQLKPSLENTLEAIVFDENLKEILKVPVSELAKQLESEELKGARYLVFDGIVSQRIVDLSEKRGLLAVVGHRVGEISRKPQSLTVSTLDDF
jgi:hypothetical protein